MEAEFNSWDKKFKNPFGAVQENTPTKWAIKVKGQVQEAILWLTKNSETPVAYHMQFNPQTQMYETEVTITSSGLYFYYFMIKQDDQVYYLERGNFGHGKITQNAQNIQSFQLTCYAQPVPEESWYQNGVVYQIFPDRFNNGLPNGEVLGKKKNTFIYATHEDTPYYIKDEQGNIARWDFYGGNFAGIIEKIPYLKRLGISAIYLNPIFLATSNHRYDTVDFMKIDPMLGSLTAFKELVWLLHKNGIHLILDGVFNHVGKDSIYFQEAIKDQKSPYYYWFNFMEYPSQYRSWWGIKTLPEVNKSNPAYQNFIYGDGGVLSKWTKLGIDGWRLDVADELPMDFLKHIRQRLDKEKCPVVIGEVWEDASHKFVNGVFRPYMSGDNLTGVMNYPARSFIISLLTKDDQIAAQDKFSQLVENYPDTFLKNCLNNIGTHDTERIKTVLDGNEKLVAIAFGLLMMLPGVPCIYYGDEAGLIGKKDPDNRRFFPWGRESEFLENTVRDLIHFRKKHLTLVDGKIGFIHVNSDINGLVRQKGEETIIFVFNKGKSEATLSESEIQVECLPANIQKKVQRELADKTVKSESYLLKLI